MTALTILHYFPTPLPGSTLGCGLFWPLLTSVFFPSCQGSLARVAGSCALKDWSSLTAHLFILHCRHLSSCHRVRPATLLGPRQRRLSWILRSPDMSDGWWVSPYRIQPNRGGARHSDLLFVTSGVCAATFISAKLERHRRVEFLSQDNEGVKSNGLGSHSHIWMHRKLLTDGPKHKRRAKDG